MVGKTRKTKVGTVRVQSDRNDFFFFFLSSTIFHTSLRLSMKFSKETRKNVLIDKVFNLAYLNCRPYLVKPLVPEVQYTCSHVNFFDFRMKTKL